MREKLVGQGGVAKTTGCIICTLILNFSVHVFSIVSVQHSLIVNF